MALLPRSAQSLLEISGVTCCSQTVLMPPELSLLSEENGFRDLKIFLTRNWKILLSRISFSRLPRFNGVRVQTELPWKEIIQSNYW